MIKFAICDDDKEYIQVVKKYIKNTYEQCNISRAEINIVEYDSAQELQNGYLHEEIDILFLDIELGDDILGFNVARELDQLKDNLAVVYMTNHEHYITKAFVCRPLGFIRKQHIEQDMKIAMYEIGSYIQKKHYYITFKDNSKDVKLNIGRVCAIEVMNHDMNIFMVDGSIRIKDQLKKYIKELETHNFVMIRRGIMLNLSYVKRIDQDIITLYNDKAFDISKDRVNEVKKQLMYYRMMR